MKKTNKITTWDVVRGLSFLSDDGIKECVRRAKKLRDANRLIVEDPLEECDEKGVEELIAICRATIDRMPENCDMYPSDDVTELMEVFDLQDRYYVDYNTCLDMIEERIAKGNLIDGHSTRGLALTVYRKVVKQGYTGFWVR